MDELKEKSKDKLPWVEKYRPSTLGDIKGHNETLKIISKYIKNKSIPHMLLYGPPGTGKTTTIMAAIKDIYGDLAGFYTCELNASDDRGVDAFRNIIGNFISSQAINMTNKNVENYIKIVILDEADAMTHDAQAILRRMMEQYSNNVRFCLICNDVNKIIDAIQSRCNKYRYSLLPKTEMLDVMINILKENKIKYEEEALNLIIHKTKGDMRLSINYMQTISLKNNTLMIDDVNTYFYNPSDKDIKKMYNSLINDNYEKAYNLVLDVLNKKNYNLHDVLFKLSDLLIKDNDVSSFNKANILINIGYNEIQLYDNLNNKMCSVAMTSAFKLSNKCFQP